MTKKIVKPALSKRYFHEVIEEEQKILDIGLKESRRAKKERQEREKERLTEYKQKIKKHFLKYSVRYHLSGFTYSKKEHYQSLLVHPSRTPPMPPP